MIDFIKNLDFMGREFKFNIGGGMGDTYKTLFKRIFIIVSSNSFLNITLVLRSGYLFTGITFNDY